ncbi:heterokaryon incompatibility protein-domain-containing protein [Aspergillus alliaceus]|uniref:Heterokaryon incompatibility protein-domain-containing protein n=1 Tax=Petromyces alliaceus TaxID=209559 RepID=A0A5N7CPU1_PETAA|nr:heterokaryon incompatibility protein-domain-containing protein [Aspergillus alliaceus]
MLCQTCQQIFSESFRHQQSDHYYDILELEQAAFNSCYICRTLWRAFSDLPPREFNKDQDSLHTKSKAASKSISQYYMRHLSPEKNGLIELDFVVDKNGVDRKGRLFTFFLQNIRDACTIFAGNVNDANSWKWSMKLAEKWLSQCLKTHDRCKATCWSNDYVPTRLLEIGQPTAEKIRLAIHPELNRRNLQYATLSHCWGTSNVLRLTSASLALLERGVRISDLAQVFQNAISTAQSLNIQYLWIDSLCIVQDSQEDWNQEAARMSDVYRGAVLNIAASVAKNSNVNCFLDKNPLLFKACMIESAWNNSENNTYHLYYDDVWNDTFQKMPLMKRAWVVQELLLASRLLHLSGNQLFWECYELNACETYPGGMPPGICEHRLPKETVWQGFNYTKRHTDTTNKSSRPQSLVLLWELWHKIVETYTSCNLTYSKDKLVALSGIAKIMQQRLEDEYCAGLWRSQLVTQLFWIVVYKEASHPQQSVYRAPSWSWASLDCHVTWGYFAKDQERVLPLVNIINCEIKIASNDITGAAEGGRLHLSGPLATIQLHPDPERDNFYFFNEVWWEDQARIFMQFDHTFRELQLHCLPLYLDNHQPPTWNVSCLLLTPVKCAKGCFRRVGVLNALSGALGIKDWSNFQGVKNEDWMEFESSCSDNCYVISIV